MLPQFRLNKYVKYIINIDSIFLTFVYLSYIALSVLGFTKRFSNKARLKEKKLFRLH